MTTLRYRDHRLLPLTRPNGVVIAISTCPPLIEADLVHDQDPHNCRTVVASQAV